MAEDWAGRTDRECGEHRTTGGRAWCYDCREWCYPEAPCVRCEVPELRAEITRLRGIVDRAQTLGVPAVAAEWTVEDIRRIEEFNAALPAPEDDDVPGPLPAQPATKMPRQFAVFPVDSDGWPILDEAIDSRCFTAAEAAALAERTIAEYAGVYPYAAFEIVPLPAQPAHQGEEGR